MSKHTPGPWHWSDNYQARDLTETWSLIGADGLGILSCDGKCNSPQEVNKADARLIAAAPDLLEALEDVLPMLEFFLQIDGEPQEGSIGYKARAAIKKATGE